MSVIRNYTKKQSLKPIKEGRNLEDHNRAKLDEHLSKAIEYAKTIEVAAEENDNFPIERTAWQMLELIRILAKQPRTRGDNIMLGMLRNQAESLCYYSNDAGVSAHVRK